MVNNFRRKFGGPDEVIIAFGDWGGHQSHEASAPDSEREEVPRALATRRVLGLFDRRVPYLEDLLWIPRPTL